DRTSQPKYGAELITACGTSHIIFHFRNGFRLAHHRSYQVERAPFDKLLLDNAAKQGAEVREEVTVQGVDFDDDGATLRIAGQPTLRARYVIDASGRNTVIGQQQGLKKNYAHLQKFAVFAHYDNVRRPPGDDGCTLTRMVRAKDRWFWVIPLSDTKTSIGMVTDTATFKQWKQSPEEALDASFREQPHFTEILADAQRVTPVYSTGDYSYRNTRLTGPRWMLIGDAAGFIDPVFSTGVFLAIASGEQAADAIHVALDRPQRALGLFAKYEKRLNRVMDLYLRFVNSWYQHEFIEVISQPTKHFNLPAAVNAVLAGNINGGFAIWWRMQLFYLVVFLQKFAALCPRLTLTPAPIASPTPSPTATTCVP
ncbi:MAG: NAD(P)/FAD-dependent oxidoreductase, partial [Chthoniobacter sp.]|uniref:NAD(P)/FAD-dependent oxidoreductase n=1 Tax=Chthoniobacter sp. TaxID=2510640 RepID=UPI0032AA68A0